MAASLTFVDQATTFPARVWPHSRGQRAPDPARLDFTALATGRIPSSARLIRTATQGAPCQPIVHQVLLAVVQGSRLNQSVLTPLLGSGRQLARQYHVWRAGTSRCGVQEARLPA